MRAATIYWGSWTEVHLMRGRLADGGIHSFVPDTQLKIMEPWLPIGNGLTFHLVVAANDVSDSNEVMDDVLAWTPMTEPVMGEPDFDDEIETTKQHQLRHLGERARWASMWWMLWPVAIFLSWRFLSQSEEHGERFHGHGFVVATLILCVAKAAMFAGFVVAFEGAFSFLGHW